MARTRYTVAFKDAVNGKEYTFYYVKGHYRYSANIRNAHGFYKLEKAEELLKQIKADGYYKEHYIVTV